MKTLMSILVLLSCFYFTAQAQTIITTNNTIAFLKLPIETVEDDKVTKAAAFPGGEIAMLTSIHENIVYPETARFNAIEGQVVVSFIIDEEGNLEAFKILRSLGEECDEAVINALTKLPSFSPAIESGKTIKQRMIVPVSFRLTVE